VWYAWSWVWPAGYDGSKVKMYLKTAMIRINIHKKKNLEEISGLKINGLEDVREGKDDPCRIKVESIIMNEKKDAVYEVLSVLCETLLSRLYLIDSMTGVPGDLSEAISTIIYAAPRLGIEELHQISQQLSVKFGSTVVNDALYNKLSQVNPKVIDGLAVSIPDEEMVKEYMRHFYAKNDPSAEQVPPPSIFNYNAYHYNTYTAPHIPSAPHSPHFLPPENPELSNDPLPPSSTVKIEKDIPELDANSDVNIDDCEPPSPLYPTLVNNSRKKARIEKIHPQQQQTTLSNKEDNSEDMGADWQSLQARLDALRNKSL